MLYLLTGAPGSGKSLAAVEWIVRERRERPSRLIYAANIDGLDVPGVVVLDDDSVLHWHEVCEPGSLLLVDEAQRYWRAQRTGDLPASVVELETHRHDGIDIVFMTQHPSFVHANIRRLVTEHVHLVAYTKSSSLRFTWRECVDDPKDGALRGSAEAKEWHYDKALFPLYRSAQLHTKRAKRPLKQTLGRLGVAFAAVLLLALFAVGGWFLWGAKGSVDTIAKASPAGAVKPVLLRPGQVAAGPGRSWSTPEEFVRAMVPRIESMPWSAPLYDGAAVVRHPRMYCIAVTGAGCSCMSEQGTKYRVSDRICRAVAIDGPPYDPYLPEPAPPPVASEASSSASAVREVSTAAAPARASSVGA